MINKEFIHVIHLFKCDRLTDQEKFFLSQLFQLKFNDELNINLLLIDWSFSTKLKRSFGNKPHEFLIYYDSPTIQLKRFKAEFIEILDSNEDKAEYDKLNNDERFFLIGNERVAKLEPKQAKKINQLIASRQFVPSIVPQSHNYHMIIPSIQQK